jgi:hypothetical protein
LSVPNNRRGRARWWSPEKWRIAFDPSPEHQDLWLFPPDTDPAILSIGAGYLPDLVKGVTDILHGEGDYSIGFEGGAPSSVSPELWFWW